MLELEPAALHRLAGYLPGGRAAPRSRLARGAARLPELSRAELVLLVERAWEELRSREAADPAPTTHDEAAAG